MARNSTRNTFTLEPTSTLTRNLTAFIDGGDYDSDDSQDNGDTQSDSSRFNLARRITKIKSYMLMIALLLALTAFFGFIITTSVHSAQLADLQADLAAHHSGRLFWLTGEDALKKPFQNRLKELLRNRTGGGVGLRSHQPQGHCIAVIYGKKGVRNLKTRDELPAAATNQCTTRFNRFAGNRTLHLLDGGLVSDCLFCGLPAAPGCRPHVQWCKALDAAEAGAVAPSVVAVDPYQGVVYFSLYNVKFPYQCAEIGRDGFLVMEHCTGKDRQLFYLDGDNRQQFSGQLTQLVRDLRLKYHLINED